MDKESQEREMLALFVHGMLFLGHVLGVFYNLRRRNYKQAFLHLLVSGYDLWAVWEHYKEVRDESDVRS